MADDQPIGDMAKELRYTVRAPFDGKALKSVPANPPSSLQAGGTAYSAASAGIVR